MIAYKAKKYRLARDITFLKDNAVVFVGRMKHDIYRAAMVHQNVGPELSQELFMNFDEAMRAGLIEEVSE